MEALGKHILAEFYNCDVAAINDEHGIENLFVQTAKDSGATVISSNFHKFSPHGVSGVVVISESHLTIHTWPEYGYCAVDVFTCGDRIDNHLCLEMLEKGLKAGNVSVVEMNRGILGHGVHGFLNAKNKMTQQEVVLEGAAA
jgi:S-adenosylmethionine decarboxylase